MIPVHSMYMVLYTPWLENWFTNNFADLPWNHFANIKFSGFPIIQYLLAMSQNTAVVEGHCLCFAHSSLHLTSLPHLNLAPSEPVLDHAYVHLLYLKLCTWTKVVSSTNSQVRIKCIHMHGDHTTEPTLYVHQTTLTPDSMYTYVSSYMAGNWRVIKFGAFPENCQTTK